MVTQLAREFGGYVIGTGHALPDSIETAIGLRLDIVPADLIPLLETAAALGPPPVGVVGEVLHEGDVELLLAKCERLGLLGVEDDGLVGSPTP
jgi:hypothetical protein